MCSVSFEGGDGVPFAVWLSIVILKDSENITLVKARFIAHSIDAFAGHFEVNDVEENPRWCWENECVSGSTRNTGWVLYSAKSPTNDHCYPYECKAESSESNISLFRHLTTFLSSPKCINISVLTEFNFAS